MNNQTLYPKLQNIIQSIPGLIPESLLFLLILILLVLGLLFKNKKDNRLFFGWITFSGLVIALIFVILQWFELDTKSGELVSQSLFNKLIKITRYEVFLKSIFLITGIFTVVFTMLTPRKLVSAEGEEYYLILVSILIGLNFLVMSDNFLMMYISLETLSIGSYILTIMNFDKKGSESAIKYILYGAFSSGIMLFGISLIYGLTGSLDMNHAYVAGNHSFVFSIAVILSVSGLLFKISTFPFHVWTPDVYQGAPTPIVSFFSVAPKAAGIAVLLKYLAFKTEGYLLPVSQNILYFIALIAIISMTIGNFSALLQKNAKRMLAYSSIAHAGFLLTAVAAFNDLSVISILFYLFVYLFMNFTAFLLVEYMYNATGSEDVNNFKGLGLKMPITGVIFVITMIALTGLPPTVGFHAKLMVFSALWQSYETTNQIIFILLLFFGLINTVISLFYYLRIPYYMYFKKAESETILTSQGVPANIFLALISLPLILLFFYPEWILNLIGNIKI